MALSALVGGMLLAQGPGLRARRMAMRGRASQELLAGYLGLTDAQKAQAKTIFDNAKTAAQALRSQLQDARTNLNAAIKAGQPVDAPAASVGNLFGQLTAIRAKAQEQFRAILTPEQLAKLDHFHAGVRNRASVKAATPANP
jgi:Spy/CpxP family protein refolding chaperone